MNSKLKGLLFGISLGLIYGLGIRLMAGHEGLKGLLTIMSLGFMFPGPLAIGFVSIYFLKGRLISKLEAFFWPFVPLLLGCLLVIWMHVEGSICVFMYLPLALLLAGVGGLLARSKYLQNSKSLLAILFLPFGAHFVEGQLNFNSDFFKVKNSIVIDGSAQEVWSQIKSVKTISQNELSDKWIHAMGFPRPLDAEINFEGSGGVRTARFERGLVFVETVDTWKPNEQLSFQIHVDPKDIPPEALDEHVTIGGPFFDVLRGTYQIHEGKNGQMTLDLESQFRLSTHFNFYAGFWTELIMHEIQSNILGVIKQRVELSKRN